METFSPSLFLRSSFLLRGQVSSASQLFSFSMWSSLLQFNPVRSRYAFAFGSSPCKLFHTCFLLLLWKVCRLLSSYRDSGIRRKWMKSDPVNVIALIIFSIREWFGEAAMVVESWSTLHCYRRRLVICFFYKKKLVVAKVVLGLTPILFGDPSSDRSFPTGCVKFDRGFSRWGLPWRIGMDYYLWISVTRPESSYFLSRVGVSFASCTCCNVLFF